MNQKLLIFCFFNWFHFDFFVICQVPLLYCFHCISIFVLLLLYSCSFFPPVLSAFAYSIFWVLLFCCCLFHFVNISYCHTNGLQILILWLEVCLRFWGGNARFRDTRPQRTPNTRGVQRENSWLHSVQGDFTFLWHLQPGIPHPYKEEGHKPQPSLKQAVNKPQISLTWLRGSSPGGSGEIRSEDGVGEDNLFICI